jgi:sacsin
MLIAREQGPALLVHNDAVFDDSDFANITQLGQSDKASKVNKIGRFGVGVNVMYHLSDVPSFVSRDRFVFFDPHACFLPGVNPAMPGKSIFFLGDDNEVVSEYSDMFAPFDAFGFSSCVPFTGTLFRRVNCSCCTCRFCI